MAKNSYSSFRLDPGLYARLYPSDAYFFIVFLLLLSTLLFFVLHEMNTVLLTETPVRHGSLNEGIVGVPVHKNPLHASNPAEEDIVALLHAGLLLRDHQGSFLPHLARSWERRDFNEYVFHIRDDALFHDGFPVTSRDVTHTVSMIQEDPDSAWFDAWNGAEVTAVNRNTVSVTVPEGNLHFPEGFTVPILPEHVWKKIPAERRKHYKGSGAHIGAGPYQYEREEFVLDDRPIRMVLTAFPDHAPGRPYIPTIVFHFFSDPAGLLEAYHAGTITSLHSVAAAEVPSLLRSNEDVTVYSADTGRVFGVFFNTEDGRIFQDPFLRSVLSQRISRERIVADIFHGRATALQAPIATDTLLADPDIPLSDLEQTLEDTGWKFEGSTGQREKDGVPLSASFVFQDVEEIRQVAEILSDGFRRLGVSVESRALPQAVLDDIVRERHFDIMLIGYDADTPKDLVSLWKSGDRENVASITGFGSPTLNALLTELEQPSAPERLDVTGGSYDKWHSMVYTDIKVEIERGAPAVFLYSPHFLYILPNDVMGVVSEGTSLGRIGSPRDRFSSVHRWHRKREEVWRIFAP